MGRGGYASDLCSIPGVIKVCEFVGIFITLLLHRYIRGSYILQKHTTENSKHIFLEKELRGHSLNFHIHVSMSYLNIPTIGLPILLQENMWTDPGNI